MNPAGLSSGSLGFYVRNDPSRTSPGGIKGGVLFVAKKPNDPQDEPVGFGGRSHLPPRDRFKILTIRLARNRDLQNGRC